MRGIFDSEAFSKEKRKTLAKSTECQSIPYELWNVKHSIHS